MDKQTMVYNAIAIFLCGMTTGLIVANWLVKRLNDSPVINVHFM